MRWLRLYRYLVLLALALLLLLLATIAFGSNPSGFASRARDLWLSFGALYFQPSEFMKIILASFMASLPRLNIAQTARADAGATGMHADA